MTLDWTRDPAWLAPPRAVRLPLDAGCFVQRRAAQVDALYSGEPVVILPAGPKKD